MLMSEVVNELPFEPLWFGVTALVLLLALLVITLVFGKGRPHA
ncbi:MAG: hypothetical protein WCA29_09200 [Jiangellales bacterium]